MLSDTPRQKLAAMIALDGIKVASDAKLCEALLRDYCGEYRVEIAALTAAVRWGIPKSLNESGLVPQATLRATLARRLQENHGLAEESAYWAVDAWASVLAHTANLSPAADESKNDQAAGDTWSMPVGQVSPQPQWQSPQPGRPYQPPSPPIQPLPKPPSEPQAPPPPRPYQPQSPPLPPIPPPLSQQPPPRPAYQAQSPTLPPLPKSPSEPQVPPPPRAPYQAQSPTLPPIPKPPYQPPPPPAAPYQPPSPPVSKPPSQPQPQPAAPYQPPSPPRPPYQPQSPPLPLRSPLSQPQSPALPLPFAAAARAFESRQMTSELTQVQTYLKTELKKRKAAALLEELRLSGVQTLSAKRLVAQAQRTEAIQHLGIALVVFMASGIMAALSVSLHLGMDEATYLLCGSAFVYLIYRGIRLIATF